MGSVRLGGQHTTLPSRLRIASAATIPLYAGFALILLSRAGLIPGTNTFFVVVAAWVLFAYFALGVFGNLTLTPTHQGAFMSSATWTGVIPPAPSTRRSARIVGVLFLAAFFAYGLGTSIATGIAGSADRSASTTLFITGATLMLLNSAMVIGIGILMFPILRPHDKAIAVGYLGTRIFEGLGLAAGVVSLAVLTESAAIHANFLAYNIAMTGLGIGSLFFCALLYSSGLVPRFLAIWGFAGYALFAAGSVLELFGVAGAGLIAAIPSGLFEVTFGIWLIARGFRSLATAVLPHPNA